MGKTTYDVRIYCLLSVLLFGIVGNILVIIFILRKKSLWSNNYYFLVLQLAICDLGVLIINLLDRIDIYWFEEELYLRSTMYCAGGTIFYLFAVAGICMMLIISVLRYRAVVHPLKPAITRRKLKAVCSLVYVVGLIAGYGIYLPLCFEQNERAYLVFLLLYEMIAHCYAPTIFMAIVYFKVGRALMKQSKHLMRVCSKAASSRHIRDQRTYFVCVTTVLCYGIGLLPLTVWVIDFIVSESFSSVGNIFFIADAALIARIAGTHSANPLIYGILDKKLLKFWKLCHKKECSSQEN